MFRNLVFLLLLTVILALGLMGCAPTTDANTDVLPADEALTANEEPTAVPVMSTIAGDEDADQADSPPATVDQAAMSSSYPSSEEADQMEQDVVQMQGDDDSGETPALVNPEPGGVSDPYPVESDVANQDNTTGTDSGIQPDGVPGGTDSGPAVSGEIAPEPQLNPETWPVYTNPPYGFQVSHPEEYVIRQPGVQIDAGIEPVPVAIVEIIDPAMAQGELAELQPPELAIRIYDNSALKPLDTWLRDAGKLNPDLGLTGESYESRAGTGVRICLQTFVAPNCSVFFANGGTVYELTPLGLVGEAMLKTFTFI